MTRQTSVFRFSEISTDIPIYKFRFTKGKPRVIWLNKRYRNEKKQLGKGGGKTRNLRTENVLQYALGKASKSQMTADVAEVEFCSHTAAPRRQKRAEAK